MSSRTLPGLGSRLSPRRISLVPLKAMGTTGAPCMNRRGEGAHAEGQQAGIVAEGAFGKEGQCFPALQGRDEVPWLRGAAPQVEALDEQGVQAPQNPAHQRFLFQLTLGDEHQGVGYGLDENQRVQVALMVGRQHKRNAGYLDPIRTVHLQADEGEPAQQPDAAPHQDPSPGEPGQRQHTEPGPRGRSGATVSRRNRHRGGRVRV